MNENERGIQQVLWLQVNAIKKQVMDTVGTNLSHEFRSEQVYQAYTGLCGEAQFAYEDGELNEATVAMLQAYAGKVIRLYQRRQ